MVGLDESLPIEHNWGQHNDFSLKKLFGAAENK